VHILEQACAYEIAIAAHLRAHVVATSGRDVTSVVSGNIPRSRARTFSFSSLSQNLEQLRHEKARVSVTGSTAQKVTPKFLMNLVPPGYPTTEKLSRGCNLEMQPRAKTTKAAYVYYALTTALLMPPMCFQRERFPSMRAFWFSWAFSVVSILLSSNDFDCSRVFSLWAKRYFKRNSTRSVTFEKPFNLTKRRH